MGNAARLGLKRNVAILTINQTAVEMGNAARLGLKQWGDGDSNCSRRKSKWGMQPDWD